MFWLAADATNMPDSDGVNSATQDGDETTCKGRLVWTVHTKVLETAPAQNCVGEDLWCCGRLRVLTSAPRSTQGKSRILFDPPARQEETSDVMMLVLDFAGVPLWQYDCLKRAAAAEKMPGPLAALLQWERPPRSRGECQRLP